MAHQGISKPGSAVQFLGSRDCFDPPSYIPYVFEVRVEYEIHINCKHCMWTTIKVSIVMQSKFTMYLKKIKEEGVRRFWFRLWKKLLPEANKQNHTLKIEKSLMTSQFTQTAYICLHVNVF